MTRSLLAPTSASAAPSALLVAYGHDGRLLYACAGDPCAWSATSRRARVRRLTRPARAVRIRTAA